VQDPFPPPLEDLTAPLTAPTILAMHRRSRDPARRLRIAVERLPARTKEAMLRGIDSNRIIVGAYVDPRSGGICPMLAAHRNGGRTNVASFARAWDEYTGARRPRRATRREVRTLRSLLESGLNLDPALERTSITELAAQIRAERAELAGCRLPDAQPTTDRPAEALPAPPEPEPEALRVRRQPLSDLLAATERELFEAPDAAGPHIAAPAEPESTPEAPAAPEPGASPEPA
jgi:hypothetical protein